MSETGPLTEVTQDKNIGISNLIQQYSEYPKVKLAAAQFEIFLKILDIFKDQLNFINVKNSEIIHSFGGSIVASDISTIFPKEFKFQIINPKKYYSLLKLFKKNSDVIILDDEPSSRYIVSNGDLKIFLPKAIEEIDTLTTHAPDMSTGELISNFAISKDFANTIREISKGSSYITYLIKEKDVRAISIPNMAISVLEKYKGDLETSKLTEETADLSLKSIAFCQIPADSYEIWIMYRDKNYIAATRQNVSGIEIFTYEELEIYSTDNFII